MVSRLIHGDCIEEMQKLADEHIKVDMVLTDIPYGTTACKWDTVIPFEEMWDCLNSIVKERTPILLFGNEPFSSFLRISNIKNYRYDWVWNKVCSTNMFNAKIMPLKPLEYISVFYLKSPTYNPIRRPKTIDYDASRTSECDKKTNIVYSQITGQNHYRRRYYVDDGFRYPINLIEFNNQKGECNNSNRVHPTQKPIPLLEYLIKTYTNENDLVLDFTMGSGSTGVACNNLGRDFIGIELDKEYYDIACERVNDSQSRLV